MHCEHVNAPTFNAGSFGKQMFVFAEYDGGESIKGKKPGDM
jgi:hypothetical protein